MALNLCLGVIEIDSVSITQVFWICRILKGNLFRHDKNSARFTFRFR